jgi:hypothetical protein
MPQEIEIVDPIRYPGWDELMLSTKNHSFFHSSHWARVLHESYGYRPLYFALVDSGRMLAMIPCMEIVSVLTGKRAVSLPFTDYCEPILEGESAGEAFHSLLNRLIAFGKEAAWKSIELRSGVSLPPRIPASRVYFGHTLDVSKNEDETFSVFRDSTKRNIRKATKEGVRVGIFNSREAVGEFYRLNCLTRKEHGLPAQPFRFFEKIYEHVLSKERGFIVLASYGDRNIAGAVYFHFGKRAVYKYGASDKRYQRLRANNLVMWEAIRWISRNGCGSLCFGRTEPDNDGLVQFKRGWSARGRAVAYYKYDMKRASFVGEASGLTEAHKKIFHRMPISLLRITGSILYRHIG